MQFCFQCCRGVRVRRKDLESQVSVASGRRRGIQHGTFRKCTWHMAIFDSADINGNQRSLTSSHGTNSQFGRRSAHVLPAGVNTRYVVSSTLPQPFKRTSYSHGGYPPSSHRPRSSAMSWNLSRENYMAHVLFKPQSHRDCRSCDVQS